MNVLLGVGQRAMVQSSWRNWCGEANPVARVDFPDGSTATAELGPDTPTCTDPATPSSLEFRRTQLVDVPTGSIDLRELTEAEETYADQISDAVASDPETAAYVEELERRADSLEELLEDDELPTGESLAAELSRFLRDRERDDGPDA